MNGKIRLLSPNGFIQIIYLKHYRTSMCGIAGIINYQQNDIDQIKKSLLHRGPDAQSVYTEKNLALIHTRLAIQDLQNGAQPFHHANCSIIFNGEIYNHAALRAELKEFNFRTQSDTETLLYLYLKYEDKMFDFLDGMFGFCIYDRNKQKLFLARDRAGKKPLYYAKLGHRFLFASELNALKCIAKLEIDEAAIACYLRTGFFYNKYTAYKGVYGLNQGSYMHVDLGSQEIKIHKYFDILSCYQRRPAYTDLESALAHADELLQKSIADRLLSSDIEVGIFLSGGIDSNLITAIAARIQSRIKSFTVKIEGGYDESHLAKLGASKYGTAHIELPISLNLDCDIEKILLAYGQPFMDSSAIPSYYVAKAAKQHVGVILNGDGADELFGGYRRYVAATHPLLKYMKYLAFLRNVLPKPNQKQSLYCYLFRFLSMSGKKNLDFYLASTTDLFEDLITFEPTNILQEIEHFIRSCNTIESLSPLKRLLYLDFHLLLFSDLLVKMDIATMANSLEGRSPFLSKYLLEFAPCLPDQFIVSGFQTKFFLRKLAEKYLPPKLIHQPKRGFEVPLAHWVDTLLKGKIHDVLSTNTYAGQYIEKNFIKQVLENKLPLPSEKRARILWNLFCLEVWYNNERKMRS